MSEVELGQSGDPRALVGGDPGAIGECAATLRRFADHLGEVADGLERIDLRQWQGEAAETFRARFGESPRAWRDAATAFGQASTAMEGFGTTVAWAQGRAAEAVDMHAGAVAASEAARADYNARVDVHRAATGAGAVPPPMEPFVDPATADLAAAQETLAAARRERDTAAARTAGEMRAAAELTAPPPSTVAQLGADVADGLGVLGTVNDRLQAGVARGVEGLVQFGRTVSPIDYYNLSHPAEYLTNVSGTAAGLVSATAHPTELIKGMVGTGWGSDPAGAAGALVPNLALDAATGGGGVAGQLGRGLRRAENRLPESMTRLADPVDAVSGAQVVADTDLALDGALPLVLSRVHVSSYELGRLFGSSWASTLDQRLQFTTGAVWVVGEAGTVVVYPAPSAQEAVLPVAPDHAPRWPLVRDADGWALSDPDAGLRRTFAANGAITGWTDTDGHRVDVDRDADGLPTAVRHTDGTHVEVSTANGRVTALILRDADRRVPIVRFGYRDGLVSDVVNSSGQALRLTYDAAARLTSWTDRNGVTYRHTYDADGRCVHGSTSDGVMAFRFDYRDGLTEMTDALGHTSTYHHNARGQVVRVVDALGAETRSTWDAADRLLARTDATGATVGYDYDDEGRLVAVEHPDGTRTVATRDAAGRVVEVVGADGAVWRQVLDARGHPSAVVEPDGAVTRYEHDDGGHLVGVTDPLGRRTAITPDAGGRPSTVTDPLGALTHVERDGFGRVAAVVDPLGARTSYAWTVEGQLAARVDPGGSRWTWTYDGEGNEVAALDPLGAETRREYGPFDVVTAVTTPDGARTELAHDPLLRVVAVTNARGLTWTYTLDAAGRTVGETDFDGRRTTLERDRLGRLVRRRNASGQEVRWAYDARGRFTERSVDGAVEHFTYDSADRLLRAVSPSTVLELVHDASGRVVAETVDGRTVATTHDLAGRPVARRTPSGIASAWTYDAAGRSAGLDIPGVGAFEFGTDAAGRETERRWGAASMSQRWDIAGRLGSQLVGDRRRDYDYRADSHLVRVDDSRDGPRELGLDVVGRVTSVGVESYRYDATGTVTDASWPAASVEDREVVGPRDVAGTRVRRAGATVYRHDADGRLVMRQRRRLSGRPLTWHFRWDALDRLVGVTTPDGARWRYRYDALGRRVAKERLDADDAVVEQVLLAWDGAVAVEQTVVGGTTTVWEGEPGSFRPLAQVELDQNEVDVRFRAIVTDLVGTPRELVDADGRVVGSARSSLWGRTSWVGESTLLRFPGQYHDDETGLAYNLHRYYDPDTGQYASVDPLGLAPSPHPRAYVSNPNAWIDPLGLRGCRPPGSAEMWTRITPLDRPWSFTSVPRAFNLETPAGAVHVAPNATKHLVERTQRLVQREGLPLGAAEMRADAQLQNLSRAIDDAVRDGIPFDRMVVVDGMELVFRAPQASGRLPALVHAQPAN